MAEAVTVTNIGDPQNINSVGTIDKLSSIQHIVPIKFCHWNAPTWGDTGEIERNSWYQLAVVAVATVNTVAQIKIVNKRHDLASDFLRLAERRQERFQNRYQPFEILMLHEARQRPLYEVNYSSIQQSYKDWSSRSYMEGQRRYADLANKYRLTVDTGIVEDGTLMESILADDGVNFGFRQQEDYAHIMNDQRWNNRAALLNLGRDLHAQSASYASAANTSLAGLSDLANQGMQGAIGLLGYLRNRQETEYPVMFSGSTALTGGPGDSLLTGAKLGTGGNTL